MKQYILMFISQMDASNPPIFLKTLSHELRWQLLKALTSTDLRVQELVQLVGQSQNLVSYHLGQLRKLGLVHERRSIADGREIYYSLNIEQIRSLFFESGRALHPVLGNSTLEDQADNFSDHWKRVLFLCTHNSARSQMAEGILRHRSKGEIDVFSAGTEPTGVHPMAVRALAEMKIDISQHISKSIETFIGQRFDYIITVCDRAREVCPVFPGDPERIHWSFPDPAEVAGSEDVSYQAFKETAGQLNTRIGYLLLMMERQK